MRDFGILLLLLKHGTLMAPTMPQEGGKQPEGDPTTYDSLITSTVPADQLWPSHRRANPKGLDELRTLLRTVSRDPTMNDLFRNNLEMASDKLEELVASWTSVDQDLRVPAAA